MKKAIFLILIFIASLVSVNAEETTNNKVDYDLVAILINSQSFFDVLFSFLQPQSSFTFGGKTYTCADSGEFIEAPFATGEPRTGITERTIRCTIESCAIQISEIEPYKFREKIYVLKDDVAVFKYLDPTKKYVWYAWRCSTDLQPIGCDLNGALINIGWFNCQNGKILECKSNNQWGYLYTCPSNACRTSATSTSQDLCASLSSRACANGKVPEKDYTCVGDGVLRQCISGSLINPSTCSVQGQYKNVCLIHESEGSGTIAEVCVAGEPAKTCMFEGKKYQVGDFVKNECSAFDETRVLKKVVTGITGTECTLGIDTEIKCDLVCEDGACKITGLQIPRTFDEFEDLTSKELRKSLCRQTSDCKPREDFEVKCIENEETKPIVDKAKEGKSIVELITQGLLGRLAFGDKDGLCVATSKTTQPPASTLGSLNPCEWGEKIVKGNGCLAGWLITFFGFIIFIVVIRGK